MESSPTAQRSTSPSQLVQASTEAMENQPIAGTSSQVALPIEQMENIETPLETRASQELDFSQTCLNAFVLTNFSENEMTYLQHLINLNALSVEEKQWVHMNSDNQSATYISPKIIGFKLRQFQQYLGIILEREIPSKEEELKLTEATFRALEIAITMKRASNLNNKHCMVALICAGFTFEDKQLLSKMIAQKTLWTVQPPRLEAEQTEQAEQASKKSIQSKILKFQKFMNIEPNETYETKTLTETALLCALNCSDKITSLDDIPLTLYKWLKLEKGAKKSLQIYSTGRPSILWSDFIGLVYLLENDADCIFTSAPTKLELIKTIVGSSKNMNANHYQVAKKFLKNNNLIIDNNLIQGKLTPTLEKYKFIAKHNTLTPQQIHKLADFPDKIKKTTSQENEIVYIEYAIRLSKRYNLLETDQPQAGPSSR